MNKVLAMVMAGGTGERLKPLTLERAKAVMPFGGKFKLIDFTLSSCINSGLLQIYVLTQYQSESIHSHIRDCWDISNIENGGFVRCVSAQEKPGVDAYRGTADAVRKNLHLVERQSIDEVLILSADHVYKMDYTQLLNYHRMKRAGVTIAAIRASKEQAAGQLGVLQVDPDNRLIGFQEKPSSPKTMAEAPGYALVSMGVYLFTVKALFQALQGEEDDFGKHIIPGLIGKADNTFVYDFEKENIIQDFALDVNTNSGEKRLVEKAADSSYWRDVGTIDAYHEANMDLVTAVPSFDLYGEKWPIRTCQRMLPPGKCVLNGKILDSIVGNGCIISGGTVRNSVLSPGVMVGKDSLVEESIIFDNTLIEPGARIMRAIVDDGCIIPAGSSIGYDAESDRAKGFVVTESGITVVWRGADANRFEQKGETNVDARQFTGVN